VAAVTEVMSATDIKNPFAAPDRCGKSAVVAARYSPDLE
jgi:hypothetical protein